uniref:Uncharacterized protein n=1 Tax=Arundo donax TaxID=35708 RepID=A0A0A8XXY1_ARUDO
MVAWVYSLSLLISCELTEESQLSVFASHKCRKKEFLCSYFSDLCKFIFTWLLLDATNNCMYIFFHII